MGDPMLPDPPSKDSNPDVFLGKDAAQPEPMIVAEDVPLGTLHIHIHNAHDIHNICIYHKQDVYAKICLTSNPQTSVSTKIINGGGRNPLFDEDLQLVVRTVDCSLKCEVWMLSRAKNYLEDQLLGFTLVPLPKIIAKNGSFTHEYSLSSNALFHSPVGFIRLTLSYVGTSPEVLAVPAPAALDVTDNNLPDSEDECPIHQELDKIEFPDLNVAKENQLMVSEIFGVLCDNLETQCSTSLITTENDCCPDSDAGVRIVESFSAGNEDAARPLKMESTTSGISVISSPATIPATPQSSLYPSGTTESKILKAEDSETADGDVESSISQTSSVIIPPLTHINIEPEQAVVQQDVVNMYMKSMQQFTESLAKMRLPRDIENSSTDLQNGDSGSEQKTPTSKASGSRVFYGSRAFF